MNIELDPWQQEILDHDGNILLCTGRQVGKTTIMAMKAAKYMVDHPDHHIIVVSLTEDQAQLMIIMILTYLEKHHRSMIGRGKHKPTKNRIRLGNKSTVLARPVGLTGDSVRGFTGNVLICDEASRMNEQIFASAKPTLMTTGGQIWMCSTPHGKQGYFYECYNNPARFKIWHQRSIDVVKNRKITNFWTVQRREENLKFIEEERRDMSFLKYGQEYLGEFMEDLTQYFSDSVIQNVMNANRDEGGEGSYFLGVDLARLGKDASTFEVIQKLGDDQLLHVDNIVTKKTRLTDSIDLIRELERQYNFKKIYIDDAGLGAGVFDSLLSFEETRRKVVAINNASRPLDRDEKQKKKILKEDLYSNLRRLMEQGRIRLLKDSDIFLSLKSIQYEYKDTGGMKIFGKDSHICEGLVRGAWAVKDKTLDIYVY